MLIPVSFPGRPAVAHRSSVLAGDIGGTKTSLGIFKWQENKLSAIKEQHCATLASGDIPTILADFLKDETLPDVMVLGVAGPVQNGSVNITNISMVVNSADISQQFNHIPVMLINDLEATAYGLSALSEDALYLIHKGKAAAYGNMAVIAPGTGLGEAGIFADGSTLRPFATEGGHGDFAPRNELDISLYRYLRSRFGHVSWERVISGEGICNIYDFLISEQYKGIMPLPAVKDKAALITSNSDSCPVCNHTVKLFLRYLAEESANLVLKINARGGIFIGGGIMPKIIPHIKNDQFVKDFCASGRLSNILQDVPVRVVLRSDTALLGAACYGLYAAYPYNPNTAITRS